MLESLFSVVASSAVIASVIGLFAWLGSRSFHSPSLWHAVWVLAIVKLFLPPIWTIPIRLSSRPIPLVTQQDSSADLAHDQNSEHTADVNRAEFAPSNQAHSNSQMASPTSSRSHTPEGLPSVSWSSTVFCIWWIGSAIVLVITSRRIARFHALVRRGTPADPSTVSLVEDLIADFSPTVSLPRVQLVGEVIPPLLWPVGTKPTIVLPATWWQATADAERRTVLMHELVHWRRGDHWVRLLQWFAGIVFWWHPLVWIARGELHRLEEQCCDSEVLYRLPGAGRSYASALVSASEWLSLAGPNQSTRLSPSPLAIPMSESTQFESFHRRIQMLPTLKYCPWTRRTILALLLATALPLWTGLSTKGQQPTEPKNTNVTNTEHSATVSGQVTDTAGKPLADAKVRVVIPAADLRLFKMTSDYREVWGQTDANGKYSLVIPGIEHDTTAAIDVLHPGHRRVGGAIMGGGGEPSDVALVPGGQAELNARLPERLYFAGQVVDESGKPIAGVEVFASLSANGGGYAIESALTDAEGKFAIYCYDATWLENSAAWRQPIASIQLTHNEYIQNTINDLQAIEPSKRDRLQVVMKKGLSLAGQVLNPDQSPAGGVAITISQPPYQRKGMLTDTNGKFRFDGVVASSTQLRVVNFVGNSKLIQTFDIDQSDLARTLTLEPVESPIATTHRVLGMTLTNITGAIVAAYGYDTPGPSPEGVMITNPGPRFESFEIGELRPGDVFMVVGTEDVGDLKKFVSHLIQEAKSPTTPPGPGVNPSAYPGGNGEMHVRVVYRYNDDRGNGTNTQYMKLTKQDVEELEKVLETL